MSKNNITIKLPFLFGDHHVLEVRKILKEIPGVIDIYASSAFKVVEIMAEESVTEDPILKILEEAGYLGDLPVMQEIEISPVEAGGKSKIFRHSALYEHTKHAISFKQEVELSNKTFWPLPGIVQAKNNEE